MRSTITLGFFALCWLSFGQFSDTRTESNGATVTVTFRGASYMGSPIKGAPYSGVEISERVQVLVDGTRIQQTEGSRKVWRDFDGRTRTERSMMAFAPPGGAPPMVAVQISDPVAGFVYVLDEESRVAHRTVMPSRPVSAPAQVAVPQAKGAPNGWKYEPLGSEVIEGVMAAGRRSTHTIPVGEVGNDRPLVTSNEYWHSGELSVLVMSKSSDPRTGDQVTRLTNISRAVPEASLFAPPPDYTVVDEKDSFSIAFKRRQ